MTVNGAPIGPAQVARHRPSTGKRLDLPGYALMVLVSLAFVLPLVWMVLTALKSADELFSLPVRWLPATPRWSNFAEAWRALPMARFYFNTAFVATAVMLLQLVNAALCAYVFVRIKFLGSNLLFLAFLSVMMIPTQVTIIPAYIILSKLQWIDTYWALIVPHMSSVFAIFLYRQAFLGIPRELFDAAVVDGAGHVRLLFQIMLPLVRPVTATLAVLSFTWQWNEYFWPLIVTNSMSMRTLPVGLVFLRAQENLWGNWHVLMAGTLLVLAPILVLFFIAQKQFVLSATRSGLTGM
jgi:sn-glycerol 3-phosphate transport system permease protein